MMSILPYGNSFSKSCSNRFSNDWLFIVPVYFKRSNQLTLTLCCNRTGTFLPFTAYAYFDSLSMQTSYISAVHLLINSGFINVHKFFLRNVFNTF